MGRKLVLGLGIAALCTVAAMTGRSSPEGDSSSHGAASTDWLMTEPGETIRELARQREIALADLTADKARLDLVNKMLGDLTKDLDKEIATDDAVAAYEDGKSCRQARLKMMKELPSFSQDDVDNTVVAIDQYRAAIIDRKETIKLRSHGGTYDVLSGQAVTLKVQIEGDQARLSHAEKRLAELRREQAAK